MRLPHALSAAPPTRAWPPSASRSSTAICLARSASRSTARRRRCATRPPTSSTTPSSRCSPAPRVWSRSMGGCDRTRPCTPETVSQLEAAVDAIYRRHSQGYRHDYHADWQVLDVAMSGLPCGKKAALATPGYFAKQRNRRGRQLGRVRAMRYHEIVVDRLFDGKTQLNVALLPLVVAAEQTLQLDEPHRQRTLIRIDAGAGSVSDINWLLFRGYHVLAKDYSTKRATLLATQVADWVTDPHEPARQIGLVPVPASEYHAGQHRRAVTRIAVRCRLATGQWGVGVVLCTLPPAEALRLCGHDPALVTDPHAC